MKRKLIILTIFGSFILFSCGNKTKNADEHEVLPENTCEMNAEQYKLAGIQLGGIEQKDLGNMLKVNGIINVPPQNMVSISATLGGYIKSTSLVPGSPVKKGQVLAVIENPEFIEIQQDYLESKSQLEFAETEYNRQKELYNENVSAAKTYQQALSTYKGLKVKVSALEQKLALIGIEAASLKEDKIMRSVPLISPITGYVKSVNVNVGKYVNPTDVVFEIINNEKLTLELTMFEKDIDKIKEGQEITFESTGNVEKKYKATVYRVGKAINDDKTVKVYASVDEHHVELLSGMYVSAIIETGNSLVEALPDEAIVSFDDKNYIFISKGKRTEDDKVVDDFLMVEIKKGKSAGGYTEVMFPENFDKKAKNIVIKGAYALLSALKNAGEMSC
ncbi:MAG TPA: efflux RND transporter periplasmic adaptor subunit [Bacteroidales bacterium]|nr:efflux RND transporter periplasmic adaptor subunit [Bacteroidales bacterium]